MRSGRTVAAIAASVSIVSALAACTSSSDAEPTGDTAAPSVVVPSREPLPQQAPTPADDAAPASWTITAAGIGPVVVGNELPGLETHLTAFTPRGTACGGTMATWVRTGTPSVRVLADAADRIVGVAVSGPSTVAPAMLSVSPRTRSGIGVGSTVAAMQRAFPAVVEFDGGTTTAGARIDSWGVPVGDRWVTFQLDGRGALVRTVWVGMQPVPPDGGCD